MTQTVSRNLPGGNGVFTLRKSREDQKRVCDQEQEPVSLPSGEGKREERKSATGTIQMEEKMKQATSSAKEVSRNSHMDGKMPSLRGMNRGKDPAIDAQIWERTTAMDTKARRQMRQNAYGEQSCDCGAGGAKEYGTSEQTRSENKNDVSPKGEPIGKAKSLGVAEAPELPPDHASKVLKDPQRFGDMSFNNQSQTVEIRLNRIPAELTRDEKKYMLQCGREGRTLGAKYQDIDAREMIRCPLESRQHTILNARNLGQSIGIHFREHHSTSNLTFIIQYTTKGKVRRIHHPETLDAKQAEKKGWIPQESGTHAQGMRGEMPPIPKPLQGKRNEPEKWSQKRGPKDGPHKPSTAIERYRQQTITEMMLNIRTMNAQGPLIGHYEGEHPSAGNKPGISVDATSTGFLICPKQGEEALSGIDLGEANREGATQEKREGLGAGSECLRNSKSANESLDDPKNDQPASQAPSYGASHKGFDTEVLKVSPHTHISDTRE